MQHFYLSSAKLLVIHLFFLRGVLVLQGNPLPIKFVSAAEMGRIAQERKHEVDRAVKRTEGKGGEGHNGTDKERRGDAPQDEDLALTEAESKTQPVKVSSDRQQSTGDLDSPTATVFHNTKSQTPST